MAFASPGNAALSLLLLASILFPAGAASCEPLACGAAGNVDSTSAALLRRRHGLSLLQVSQVKSLSETSVFRVQDVAVAAHIRKMLEDPSKIGLSLLAGLNAIKSASDDFMAEPPKIPDGISTLSIGLFAALQEFIPPEIKGTEDFAEFETAWMKTFTTLPSMVQSIEEDLRDFAGMGDADKLVRAVNTLLLEASTVVSKLLPEETGNEVAKYIGAVADLFDGVGDGIEMFTKGNSAAAVEAVYAGLRAATRDLVPASLQNDSTYKAIVGILDQSVGALSKHILQFQQHLAEANVCWKGWKDRARQRPSRCDHGYSWDGEQWCLSRQIESNAFQVEPYTIQSVKSSKYLNVAAGSTESGANVHVWGNPDSPHSQWRFTRLASGYHAIQNVHSGLYLHAQGGSPKKGANLEVSHNGTSPASSWRMRPTGQPGVIAIESRDSGLFVNLWGGDLALGANTVLWDNPQSEDSLWRIETASRHQVVGPQALQPAGVALLDQTVKRKGTPEGAMPARCDEASAFSEKRGAWCYERCPAGYVASGTRCKAVCSVAFPNDSDLMCGKVPGAVEVAVAKMVVDTTRQLIAIEGLAAGMDSSGVAGGLTGTMEAFIDMGKPFAYPVCPL